MAYRRAGQVARALAGLTFGLLAAGCTELKPGDDTEQADPATEFAALDSARKWGCLSRLAPTEEVVTATDDGGRWVYSARTRSLFTGQVLPNVVVRACVTADVDCRDPLGGERIADAEGWVDIPISDGFRGFFQFTGPSIIPTMLFYSQLLPTSTLLSPDVVLLEPEALPALVAVSGTTQDPNDGILAVRVHDCEGTPAAGVELVHDREGQPWYFVEGLPSPVADATGNEGVGGFSSVPPGVSVLSTRLPNGTALTENHSVVVRTGWLTALVVDPTGTEP